MDDDSAEIDGRRLALLVAQQDADHERIARAWEAFAQETAALVLQLLKEKLGSP